MTRDLKLVSLALMLWGLGETLFFFTQTLYLEELGANPVQIGSYLGLFAAAMTVTHLPAGWLADRFGRRPLLIAGWVIGLVSSLMMFLARSLAVFVPALVIYGFTGFVIAPLSSYITAARGDWSVPRALTTGYAAFNIGGVVGPLLAFTIADHLNLRSTYGLASIFFAASTASLFLLRPQPVERRVDGAQAHSPLNNSRFLFFLVISAWVLIGGNLSWPLTPNFLQTVRGVSVRAIWLFGAFNSLGMSLISIWLGRLSPKMSFMILQTIVGASVLLFWQIASLPWFALAYFLAGGFRAFRSLTSAQVETLVDARNMGLAFGAVETMIGLVMIGTPPVAGFLYDIRPELPFIVSLGVLVVGLPISLTMFPRARPRPVVVRSASGIERVQEEDLQ